jgi:hypothetical protein
MAGRKPREQIFDLRDDPDEVNDLAADPRYAGVLAKFRKALRDWQLEIQDLGFLPESQMWLDFDGSEYEAIRADPTRYPLETILTAADSVGAGLDALDGQTENLANADPTVRFWAATGVLAQGQAAAKAKPALRGRLADPSVAVQTVAALALCSLDECEKALGVLLKILDHPQECAALRAANALDHLDEAARPALAAMKAHIEASAQLEGRDFFAKAPYTHWVLRAAVGELEGERRPGVARSALQ